MAVLGLRDALVRLAVIGPMRHGSLLPWREGRTRVSPVTDGDGGGFCCAGYTRTAVVYLLRVFFFLQAAGSCNLSVGKSPHDFGVSNLTASSVL